VRALGRKHARIVDKHIQGCAGSQEAAGELANRGETRQVTAMEINRRRAGGSGYSPEGPFAALAATDDHVDLGT
jgi:hypothetical protein